MNGIELKIPIRLYWDVSPVPTGPITDHEAICRDILDLKILSVNLVDREPQLTPESLRVLSRLKGKAAVALTVSSEAYNGLDSATCEDLGLKALLVYVDSLERLRSVSFSRMPSPSVGASFEVTSTNWRDLPQVVDYCATQGISLLSLPMQRLLDGQHPFFLTGEEKRELSASLHRVPLPPLKYTIHDPFLWKLFFPGLPFPDGGCQAANTMIYISPGGDVYPCPTLPVKVGNLLSHSLREIIQSQQKADTRADILQIPAACAGCAEAFSCKGGCRGRACAHQGVLDSADPGCVS